MSHLGISPLGFVNPYVEVIMVLKYFIMLTCCMFLSNFRSSLNMAQNTSFSWPKEPPPETSTPEKSNNRKPGSCAV